LVHNPTLFYYLAPAPTEPHTLSLHDALPISTKPLQYWGGSCGAGSCHGQVVALAFAAISVRVRASSVLVMWKSRLCNGQSSSPRSEEHTSEFQSRENLVCRLLLQKKKPNRTA